MGAIASVTLVANSIAYYFHEHLWARIDFGRQYLGCDKGALVWFTGLSGSGKTTLADAVASRLEARMVKTERIDGDVARRTFSSDLGFSAEDRAENCRRAAHVGSYLRQSNIVLASFISPYRKIREYVRGLAGKDAVIIWVRCHIDECIRRDPKGMYADVVKGKYRGQPFTGLHPSAPYEVPIGADLVVDTKTSSLDECVDQVVNCLEEKGYV
jgi:adenylylsulfate kinase